VLKLTLFAETSSVVDQLYTKLQTGQIPSVKTDITLRYRNI